MSGLIPITIVAGYLGAGKTTLIAELLASPQRERIGLVVNDFGEIPVDATLLGDDVIGFDNGCVCCTAQDGMGPALARLREIGVDRIIIEASGVADPAAVAAWSATPGHAPGGIVVCADATALPARLRDRWVGETVARQLAAADAVILTHVDLTTEEAVEGAAFLARCRAPGARVHLRRDGIDLGTVIREIDPIPRRFATQAAHAAHDTVTLRSSGEVDERALRRVFALAPSSIRRAKGFLPIAGRGTCTVQYAGARLEITAPPDRLPDESRGGLVVILDADAPFDLTPFDAIGLRRPEPILATPKGSTHAHAH